MIKKQVHFKEKVEFREFEKYDHEVDEIVYEKLKINSRKDTRNGKIEEQRDQIEGEEENDDGEITSEESDMVDIDNDDFEQESEKNNIKGNKKPFKLRMPSSFRFLPLRNTYEFDELCKLLRLIPSSEKKKSSQICSTLEELISEIRAPTAATNANEHVNAEFEGGKSITFTISDEKKKKLTRAERQAAHIEERRQVHRPAGSVMRHLKPLPRTVQSRPFFRNAKKRRH